MTLTIDRSFASPNFNERPVGVQPSALVIHTTEGIWPSDIKWLCSKASQVSSHYVIAPAGQVYQLVDDQYRAWHAGVGTFLGISDWNDISLGIELSHVKGQPVSMAQRDALTELCRIKIAEHHITEPMIVAHRWIAPTRRSDPTDWPDAEFRAWIHRLYASQVDADDLAAWGPQPYRPDWGIPRRWRLERRQGNDLGAAVTDEIGVGDVQAQRFTHAVILYHNGETKVVML